MSTPPISVAEACEMVATEDSWLNDGVTGVVRSIRAPQPSAQKRFWKCVLADTVGSATINFTLFTAPKFSEGDTIDITGKGIKRKEYNGTAEIGIGKSTEIHVVGRSVHHEEQKERAAAGAPALNGQLQPVVGQAVGCALNQAIETHRYIYSRDELREMLKRPGLFWQSIHEMASDQLRVARLLEKGKLALSIREREGRGGTPAPAHEEQEEEAPPPPPPPLPPTPTPTPRAKPTAPKPGPDNSVALDAGTEEDIPF